MMNKQLWYANSTGGVPYTYGEVIHRGACDFCESLGTGYDEFVGTFEGVKMFHFSPNKYGRDLCPQCNGEGIVKRLV